MGPKEYSASEAKRLLEELAPYFAELERETLEAIVRIPAWYRWSDRKRRCLADRINVIRDVQAKLKTIIAMGKPRTNRVA